MNWKRYCIGAMVLCPPPRDPGLPYSARYQLKPESQKARRELDSEPMGKSEDVDT